MQAIVRIAMSSAPDISGLQSRSPSPNEEVIGRGPPTGLGKSASASEKHGSFSIVIPTHNRREKLGSLLRSIAENRSDALDSVIVVDDSDESADLGEEFAGLSLEYIVLEKRVFMSRAKNIGWREAKSEFVYFIDDDNRVRRDTFEVPLRFVASAPGVAAVVPAVLYLKRPDLVWVYATPLSPQRWGHRLVGRNEPRNPLLEGLLLDTDALPNAAIVRRQALEDIGGFREDLVVNSSADAAIRLKRRGWQVLAHTGAFIFHDVEPPGRMGWWSRHGVADPERVYHEVRDWFRLMRSLHSGQSLFAVRGTVHALGFMLPNGLSYLLERSSRGRECLKQLAKGYLEGVKATRA